MHSCREGIFVHSGPITFGLVLTLWFLVFQASSVVGQDPSIEFDQTEFRPAREGYASLRWNAVAEATEYRLSDAQGKVLYRGEFPQAFVSGLPDGTHEYRVQANDAYGNLLAESSRPAILRVAHWPMSQAIGSFLVGLVVFAALVGVIIRGQRATGEVR